MPNRPPPFHRLFSAYPSPAGHYTPFPAGHYTPSPLLPVVHKRFIRIYPDEYFDFEDLDEFIDPQEYLDAPKLIVYDIENATPPSSRLHSAKSFRTLEDDLLSHRYTGSSTWKIAGKKNMVSQKVQLPSILIEVSEQKDAAERALEEEILEFARMNPIFVLVIISSDHKFVEFLRKTLEKMGCKFYIIFVIFNRKTTSDSVVEYAKARGALMSWPRVRMGVPATLNSRMLGRTIELEYIDSENLEDISDLHSSLDTLLARLDSNDLVSICEALKNVRQIAIYHKERLLDKLKTVIPLVVKSLKSPRSAICKTANMTSVDILKAYSSNSTLDELLDLLLEPLLQKSLHRYNKSVREAAEAALIAMTTWRNSLTLLPKLLPFLKHKNPGLRAKASMCMSRLVPRLGLEGIRAYGIDKLLEIAAFQLGDRLPESKEAARVLAIELQIVYGKSKVLPPCEESMGSINVDSWEAFCQAKLSPWSAQAILDVTSAPNET